MDVARSALPCDETGAILELKRSARRPRMTPIWEGNLSFALVNIPIALYSAIARNDLHFRFLHKTCGTPLEYQRYCPQHGKEVEWEEVERGYEWEKGKFVVLTEEDLEQADVELTRSIEVLDFVELQDIPPIYFEKPYYLVPQKEAAKSFHLLAAALREEGKVGIANVVIKTRQYLAAIIPHRDGLVLETLYFDHEVRQLADLELPAAPEATHKELQLAKQIVGSLTEKFDPTKYTDDYRAKLLEVIEQKAAGRHVVSQKGKVKREEVRDLIATLEESIKEISKRRKAA
jgi:DNA end-binding protein Ku